MSGKNQITGGSFQDFEGNVLANGYLTMQLSHDEQETVDPGVVVAAYPLRVPLDANGNIAGSVFVWPNDQLNPANSYYIVNAYRADGTQAWLSAQNFTVTTSPSPFNVGAWVPNNPPTAGAPVGSILLQTNSVNNTNQALLNLIPGSNITLTNVGGAVTIAGRSTNAVYMIGGGMMTVPLVNPTGFFPSVDTALDVMALSFSFPATLTFNTISFAWTSGQSNPHFAAALYSIAGALLWQSGSITLGSFTSGTSEVTVPSYTLTAGSYYIATTTDASQGGFTIQGFPLNTMTVGSSNCFNFSKPVIGVAANAATSGPLTFPSTLGTVNGVSAHGNTWAFPYVMFYNLP